jgi:pimeloyl-ACP methyl ester carboxylesterase
MTSIVLVHGAWEAGWCWRRVVPLLREAGHEVFAPTLTGLGERKHLATPEVGLDTHVQDIVGVLETEELDGVILVGHSYGGMVISGVAECVPECLAHLVYLDAFVPEDGQSALDLLPPDTQRGMADRVQAEGDGWRLPSVVSGTWETVLREYWKVTDPSDLAWLAAHLDPQPFKTMTDRLACTSPAARALPRTYIRCSMSGNPAFVQAAERAQRPGSGWQYFELPTAHLAMVTMPDELAELLLDVAGAPAPPVG